MQNSCLYFIFNDCHSSYDKLLENINRPSLHNGRIHDMLTLVYKSFHDLAPCYINELLIERNSSYNLCGSLSLSIPRVQSTKYGLHSFHYSGSKYWNTLPELLRTAESLHVFLNKNLRALAVIINAAPFVISLYIYSHNVYNIFLVCVIIYSITLFQLPFSFIFYLFCFSFGDISVYAIFEIQSEIKLLIDWLSFNFHYSLNFRYLPKEFVLLYSITVGRSVVFKSATAELVLDEFSLFLVLLFFIWILK